jgi:glutamine synthetase
MPSRPDSVFFAPDDLVSNALPATSETVTETSTASVGESPVDESNSSSSDDLMRPNSSRGLNKDEQKSIDFVLKAAQERQIKFVRLWFTDILGMLKSVAIIADELESALDEGITFDGGAIEGFARQDESDMIALPDPTPLPFCLSRRAKALSRACFAIS